MARQTRRNGSNIQTTLKDYIVPIIGGLLVLILLYSFFRGESPSADVNTNENKVPAILSFGSTDTKAYILYSGNEKKEISSGASIYKGETLIIREGTVGIIAPDRSKINLNKIGELKFNEDGSYSLVSSDAWFTLEKDAKISMRYANIQAAAGAVISLTQNEAGSTLYVLAGTAKVSNLGGVSTLLVKGQKISVSRLNAANKDADLSSEKGTIDSYFKGSDWFIENDGNAILSLVDDTLTTDDTGSGALSGEEDLLGDASGGYISLNSLRDEMSVDTSTIIVSGKILDSSVGTLTINNKQVSINTSDRSFTLDGVATNKSINDIVVKIYDSNKSILQKKVYTVYSSNTSTVIDTPDIPASNINKDTPPTNQSATNYDIDATKFSFTDPSTNNKFSTTSGEITIRGKTSVKGIASVKVNGLKLTSFNGTTWRYHAFEKFDTLKEGTNQYKVDYIGDNGAILYTDYYTIVKKAPGTITPTPKPEAVTEEKKETPNPQDIPDEEALFSE